MRTLMIVVLLCLAGCSNWADPTKRFLRQIFKDASVKVAKLADSAKDISSGKVQGTRKMMFSKTTLSYDVKKTDSTVTPLIGFIIATVPFTFAVPNAEPEKFPDSPTSLHMNIKMGRGSRRATRRRYRNLKTRQRIKKEMPNLKS